jgi:hypothetical protein
MARGDYSQWFRDKIKDDELANTAVSKEKDGADAVGSRHWIKGGDRTALYQPRVTHNVSDRNGRPKERAPGPRD